MKSVLRFLPLTISCVSLLLGACATQTALDNQQAFIQEMAAKHPFTEAELHDLFTSVDIKDEIIRRMSKPAEALPWYKYRKIFLTENRIKRGVQFWQANKNALAEAEKHFGVPAEIIVAIIGVESQYGQHTGKYRVIDALSTLAFAYPARAAFFRSELENFLLLCRDEHTDPLKPTGSYAGAMGMPQFMPSSFINFAVDYDQDNRRDIWHHPGDVIFSVAHYFAQHHWQTGQDIAYPVTATGNEYQKALTPGLKPDLSKAELESLNIHLPESFTADNKAKLLDFDEESGHYLLASLENFYVITRYNHSPLYALAVFQLSQALKLAVPSL